MSGKITRFSRHGTAWYQNSIVGTRRGNSKGSEGDGKCGYVSQVAKREGTRHARGKESAVDTTIDSKHQFRVGNHIDRLSTID